MSNFFDEFNHFMDEIPNDIKKALGEVGKYVKKETKNRIRSGQALGPPLKPATVAQKGHSIKMVDSHNLEQKVYYFTGSDYCFNWHY
jgi:hypothetical protein